MHLRNIRAALSNPALALEYLRWRFENLRSSGNATFTLINHARIGNFIGFSEYHSLIGCISRAEQEFFLSRTAKVEGDIIDIGANIGIVSILLAKQFRARTVHAIEPADTTFSALQKNVALNDLVNVKCHRLAISDVPGTIAFNADPTQRATARIAVASDSHIQVVETMTLDAFVDKEAIGAIALLKIDVEGFESNVVRGGAQMLDRRLPRIIFMEICPALSVSAGYDAAEPARLIGEAGYDWFRLDDNGALVPVLPGDAAQVALENWVALPR